VVDRWQGESTLRLDAVAPRSLAFAVEKTPRNFSREPIKIFLGKISRRKNFLSRKIFLVFRRILLKNAKNRL